MSKEELHHMNEDELSLPDQEQSWQKMKHLLEEDDKKRPVLPPALLRSCAGWGLLAAGILAVWFFANPQSWFHSNGTAVTEQTNHDKNDKPGINTSGTAPEKTATKNGIASPNETTIEFTPSGKGKPANHKASETVQVENSAPSINDAPKENTVERTVSPLKTSTTKEKKSTGRSAKKTNPAPVHPANTDPRSHSNLSTPLLQDLTDKDNRIEKTETSEPKKDPYGKASLKPVPDKETPPADNPVTPSKDSSVQFDSSTLEKPVPSPLKKRKFFVTAGVGLQQQIRLNSRDSLEEFDRKTSLSDYVPSLYVRLQKEDKWFLQGEFRYGAPQSLREFSYSRQTKYDGMVVTTTTLKLRKTYYHQLPFSFNYYLRPNLSVGAGGIYSRFYRAVTEEEIKSRNILTQSETVAKKIVEVPHFTDSFFYKTQVHLLLQADYEWRRFSLGVRYTKDIQPYIKYTQPDGRVNEEKNQTFQILLRYRLWKSKRFNINI